MCLQPQGEGALCRQLDQTQPDDGIWQNKINPVGELLRGTRGQKERRLSSTESRMSGDKERSARLGQLRDDVSGNTGWPQPAGPASSHPREVWSQFFGCCRAEPREGLEIEEAERGVSRKGWG